MGIKRSMSASKISFASKYFIIVYWKCSDRILANETSVPAQPETWRITRRPQ